MGTRARDPDKVFGFSPGNGVHDIHTNQGNAQQFRGDDGVWPDGGLLLRFPAQDQWVAVFLAFQSQPGTPTTRPGTPSPVPGPGSRRPTSGSASSRRW